MTKGRQKVWLLAGEASGDVIGARLIQALRQALPQLQFRGVGGPRMQEAGLESIFPMQDLSVMGLVEILPRLRLLSQRMRQSVSDIQQTRPDVVVTIDSPGFALRLLKRIQGLGIPRVHYVAPQVWAWKESRIQSFPGLWEKLLCILPFEEDYFGRHGVECSFVGHPIIESGAGSGRAEHFLQQHNIDHDAVILVLMPGSRRSEISRLMPIFGKTIRELKRKFASIRPVLPVSASNAPFVTRLSATWSVRPIVIADKVQEKYDAFAAAHAALTKSGTSTLEIALAGVPMAVAYRVNPLTAALARRLIKVPHVALVNLLAQKDVIPELLQERCRPHCLAETISNLILNPELRKHQKDAFTSIISSLSVDGITPSRAAAEEILHHLR